MKNKLLALLLCAALLLTGCRDRGNGGGGGGAPSGEGGLGGDDTSFGDDLDNLGAYDGSFEGEASDVTVEYISGTEGAYKLEGSTLTFNAINEDSVYLISGKFSGNTISDIYTGLRRSYSRCKSVTEIITVNH